MGLIFFSPIRVGDNRLKRYLTFSSFSTPTVVSKICRNQCRRSDVCCELGWNRKYSAVCSRWISEDYKVWSNRKLPHQTAKTYYSHGQNKCKRYIIRHALKFSAVRVMLMRIFKTRFTDFRVGTTRRHDIVLSGIIFSEFTTSSIRKHLNT